MPCRVGITTDPKRRHKEWKKKIPSLRKWEILAKGLTKDRAQTLEEQEARKRGCESSKGGRGVPGALWYVYHFEHA